MCVCAGEESPAPLLVAGRGERAAPGWARSKEDAAPLPSPSPGPGEPSPSCWEPWLSGILGEWPLVSGVFPGLGKGFDAPQPAPAGNSAQQNCTHIALSADFGSIISPVLAEQMPFPWLPGELLAVPALRSSSWHVHSCCCPCPCHPFSFGCFPCPLGTETLLLSIAKKRGFFHRAKCPSPLPPAEMPTGDEASGI